MQGRVHNLDFIGFWRRHQTLLPAKVDVSLMRRIVEKVDPTRAHRFWPGQTLDGGYLVNKVGHDLIIGRHWLAAALIVKLPPVVIRRIMRRRNVQSPLSTQE